MPMLIDSYTICVDGHQPLRELFGRIPVFAYESDPAMDEGMRQLCSLFGKKKNTGIGEIPRLQIEKSIYLNNNAEATVDCLTIESDLPFWVGNVVRDYVNAFVHISRDPETKILVDTAEVFDTWLGEAPVPSDFTSDLILISTVRGFMDPDKLKEFENAPYGWEFPNGSFPVFFTISSITKENVVLRPYGDIIKLIPYCVSHTIEEFKQLCVAHKCCLFASSTSVNTPV